MRTYSRKRAEHQEIEEIEGLCRLCLGKADEAVPLFPEDSGVVCTLSMRIMICVGLEMTHEENLPNMICKDCYRELERYYTFRKKCEVTYQKLKAHVSAVKRREYHKAVEVNKKRLVEEQEAASEPQQHLLLTINDQQVELVDVDNLDSVQLESLQGLATLERVEEFADTREEQRKEVQIQDIRTTDPSLPMLEIQTISDLSLIMSTMLVELGVLRQDEQGLVLVDDSLKTVELEGEDDAKIVLRLMEEGEEENGEVPETNQPAILSPQNRTPVKDVISIPSKNKEGGGKAAWCGQCGKRFASRSVLARHRRVHSGERPHACSRCPRAFAQRAVLQRHELLHDETRPFECGVCGRGFTQRGALAAHARSHAPALALHRCSVCDKVFLYPSGLSRHMGVHQGRSYACAGCARVFRDQSSLRRHAAAHKRAALPPARLPRLTPAVPPPPVAADT